MVRQRGGARPHRAAPAGATFQIIFFPPPISIFIRYFISFSILSFAIACRVTPPRRPFYCRCPFAFIFDARAIHTAASPASFIFRYSRVWLILLFFRHAAMSCRLSLSLRQFAISCHA